MGNHPHLSITPEHALTPSTHPAPQLASPDHNIITLTPRPTSNPSTHLRLDIRVQTILLILIIKLLRLAVHTHGELAHW